MAEEVLSPVAGADTEEEKKRLKEERKQLKNEKKAQRKEAKQRAKEISQQEEQLDDEGGISVVIVTIVIVLIWIAILCLLIKLDVGGFGSGVLAPVLKDVPVINKILPSDSVDIPGEDEEEEDYGGYTDLRVAVDYIRELELELEIAQTTNNTDYEEIEALRAEIDRLQTFEDAQIEFERIKTEFYEEVVYADNGPGVEEYQKYYESMDPATAEYLYKQVLEQEETNQEIQDYVQTYSEMKPAQAASIFEEMTEDLDLVAKILYEMSAEDRAKIMGAMDSETAARLTRILDPDS